LTLATQIPEQEVPVMTLAIAWKRNPALLVAIIIALFLAVAVVGSAYGNGQLPLIGHNAPTGCPPSC